MTGKNKDELVNLVKWPMISCGMWPRAVSKNPILNKINFVYSVFTRLNYFIFYVGIIMELIRLIVQNYDISKIITSLSVVVTATKIVVIVIIYLKNYVLELMDEVTKKEGKMWEENDDKIKAMFLEKLKMGKFFSISLWTSTFLTVIAINFSGVINNNNLKKYNEANNASLESHFLYQFWFPANKLEHLVAVTSISLVLSYGAMIYNVTTNLIVVMLCLHSATHLAILQHRLRNYISDEFNEDQMYKAIYTLKDFVFQHRYLIAFTVHVNNCCRNIIMMEFVLTSVDVGTVALNIIKMNLSDMGYLVFYLQMLVLQIYSLAWSANEVNIQSQGVADAAYESRWHLLNKEGKQLTHIIIQQAQQRPLIMNIGPFGPMTMVTFLMILKTAYSYVSIMKN